MAVTKNIYNQTLEDLVTILVEMEGNVSGVVDVSKIGKGRSGRYEFVGERGASFMGNRSMAASAGYKGQPSRYCRHSLAGRVAELS